MPPKKIVASSRASSAKKVTKKTNTPLPKYKDLIVEAVLSLSERGGSSRQAIKKYIKDKYTVGSNFDGQFNLAVKRGLDAGDLSQPKGPAGSIKLLKKAVEAKGGVPVKKVSKKKVATVKKITGGKKVATKKAVAKKPARTSLTAAKSGKVKKVSRPTAVVKKKVVSASTKAKKPTAAKKKTKKAIKSA